MVYYIERETTVKANIDMQQTCKREVRVWKKRKSSLIWLFKSTASHLEPELDFFFLTLLVPGTLWPLSVIRNLGREANSQMGGGGLTGVDRYKLNIIICHLPINLKPH